MLMTQITSPVLKAQGSSLPRCTLLTAKANPEQLEASAVIPQPHLTY